MRQNKNVSHIIKPFNAYHTDPVFMVMKKNQRAFTKGVDISVKMMAGEKDMNWPK